MNEWIWTSSWTRSPSSSGSEHVVWQGGGTSGVSTGQPFLNQNLLNRTSLVLLPAVKEQLKKHTEVHRQQTWICSPEDEPFMCSCSSSQLLSWGWSRTFDVPVQYTWSCCSFVNKCLLHFTFILPVIFNLFTCNPQHITVKQTLCLFTQKQLIVGPLAGWFLPTEFGADPAFFLAVLGSVRFGSYKGRNL